MAKQVQDIAIVGGGLSGLAAALELESRGVRADLFEKSDRLGGKLRTDEVEGFYLDRGFQVILPGYAELKRLKILNSVDFRHYRQGAVLETDRGQREIAYPLESPLVALKSLFEDVVSAADLRAMFNLWRWIHSKAQPEDLLSISRLKTNTTSAFLRELGFTVRFISEFWVPFFSGIYLEPVNEEGELTTSAALFVFLVRTFAIEPVGIPALGVEELIRAISQRLKITQIHLNSMVDTNGPDTDADEIEVNGTIRKYRAVIDTTQRHLEPPQGVVTTIWLAGTSSDLKRLRRYGNRLVLVSRKDAPLVNHFAVVSEVSPRLAPPGQSLISLNSIAVLNDDQVLEVVSQFKIVLGPEGDRLRMLRVDRISDAFSLLSCDREGWQKAPTQQSALAHGRALAAQAINSLGL